MQPIKLMPTGIPNLDAVLDGGIPIYSLNILAGQPGTGKTIISQQMLFNFARLHPHSNVLSLVTLSEPMVKVVRYMQYFSFFDAEVFGEQVHYRDIGAFIREHSLADITTQILNLVEEHRPELLIIDSFRAIHDLSEEVGTFRRFCYDLSVRLASARCTTLLVGEYDHASIATEVEFTIADGIIYLNMENQDGEDRRMLQIYKLRGCKAEMSPFLFKITEAGARVLSPALSLQRHAPPPERQGPIPTGISGLDSLLQGGFPAGRSVILSGVSGTGKSTFGLQFLIEGARQGERGLIFSFEESPDRLHAMAASFGWNLREYEAQGLLRIVFISQTNIRVEDNLEQMVELFGAFRPHRFVIDSFSIFLHKMRNPVMQREKAFQIASMIRHMGAVGLLISDILAGETRHLSRFGVEETVGDGTIVLSTDMIRMKRRRYLEIFKMRASNHVTGRHRMEITETGIQVYYYEKPALSDTETSPPLLFGPLQCMTSQQLPHGLSWLVGGEPGIGKSMLAYQFAIEGLQHGEAVLFVAADSPTYHVLQAMQNFDFSPHPYLESGQLVILDAFSGGPGSLDLSDPDVLLFTIARRVEAMPRPLRTVFDSLMPQGLGYSADEFVSLIHRKNRMLHQPGITLFDTLPHQVLESRNLQRLYNAFDVILDMYTPDWGDMGLVGSSTYRVLKIYKAPASIDMRPYPYLIDPNQGIVIQENFYR